MSPINSEELQRIFNKLDKNGDGVVCLSELNWLLERIGVNFSIEELESLLQKQSLDFNEFVLFYQSISKQNKEEEEEEKEEEEIVYKAFKVFDLNDDGFISCEELHSVLSRLELWDGSDCRSMIRAYDTNSDGKLDFQEFKNMMLLTI